MPPILLLFRFGHIRWLYLPLPLFLLWPLMLLAVLILGLAWLVTLGRSRIVLAGFLILSAMTELRGTSIDLRGQDAAVHVRFI